MVQSRGRMDVQELLRIGGDHVTIELPGIIAWILVGLAAGWLASSIMHRKGSLITNILLGLVGSIVGGVLFSLLGLHGGGNLLGSILIATVGAIVILAIVN
jgi:uncharacterized membrane protein YeaQ/YmgE (transglycosylase-associated protein family)